MHHLFIVIVDSWEHFRRISICTLDTLSPGVIGVPAGVTWCAFVHLC